MASKKKARVSACSMLAGMEMNEERFLPLITRLISESEFLQNNPSQGLVPQEDRASDHLLELLMPHATENGGPLRVERVSYTPGRGNLVICYPGEDFRVGESGIPGMDAGPSVAFVGSHLDVVPANPETWDRNPFVLTREGDRLYGRGTTDCLGHVALITDMMIQLAERRPSLKRSVYAVFIVNEENSIVPGIGVDELSRTGRLDAIKNGPVYWVDSADSQPCLGTAGMAQWELKVFGKGFHSGLPHKAINPIELGMEVCAIVQRRFYEDFPRVPQEEEYRFMTCSTLKPTRVESGSGSLNTIPPSCSISGDIRLTPFYDIKDVKTAVERYVREINESLTDLPSRGPHSKYELPAESRIGRVELEWIFDGENGIAVNLQSEGHAALVKSTERTLGKAEPFAICGSLPLVRSLQDDGFDIQISGYGVSAAYHAENEYAELNHLRDATKILSGIIAALEDPEEFQALAAASASMTKSDAPAAGTNGAGDGDGETEQEAAPPSAATAVAAAVAAVTGDSNGST